MDNERKSLHTRTSTWTGYYVFREWRKIANDAVKWNKLSVKIRNDEWHKCQINNLHNCTMNKLYQNVGEAMRSDRIEEYSVVESSDYTIWISADVEPCRCWRFVHHFLKWAHTAASTHKCVCVLCSVSSSSGSVIRFQIIRINIRCIVPWIAM